MTVAQLSDLHIVARGAPQKPGVDPAANLRAAVAHVLGLDPLPELVVVSGDLVDRGDAAEYDHLRELLDPVIDRLRLLPGNHDHLPSLAAAFPEVPGLHLERASFVDDLHDGLHDGPQDAGGPMRIIGLDTHRPGLESGRLDAEQLDWLDHLLIQPGEPPTLVVLHHPVHPTGIWFMDQMRLHPSDAAALGRVVERHAQVQVIAAGHVHRSSVTLWHGAIAMTVPSVAHAIDLQLSERTPGWRPEPPQFALHALVDGRIVTHLASVHEHPLMTF